MRLGSFMSDIEKNQRLVSKIDHFLYRATCVLVSLDGMYNSQKSAISFVGSYIKQIKFGEDNKIGISAEPLFEAYSQIPSTLTQIVNMQNQMLEILQGALKIRGSVPKSLREAVGKGLKKYNFPDCVCEMIEAYWRNGGEYLRNIRDINEHHIALVDVTYFKYENGRGTIVIYLPDNPETKSLKRFTYNNEIDAYSTIYKGFFEFAELIDAIFEFIGVEPIKFGNTMALNHLGILKENQKRTLAMMISIAGTKEDEFGKMLLLDTIELQQIIPKEPNGGNIAVRKMKTDLEVFDE
jgi:hypothetical protein